MIIKQHDGKYCEMNHEGECLGFNLTGKKSPTSIGGGMNCLSAVG